MSLTIEKTLEILARDEKEIEKKIQLVKGFNELSTSDFTEEVYHKICRTPLRNAGVVAEKIVTAFPFISLSINGDNSIICKFNDIEDNEFYNICVVIPKTTEKRITIIITQKVICRYDISDIKRIEKQIEELKTILSSSPLQRFKARIKYNMKRKYKDSIQETIKLKEISILRIKKEMLEYENIKKKYEEIENEIVNKYVPLFLEWTSEVIIRNGMYEYKFTK